ncbi:hypothetical protein IFM89_031204, partial [Coptis chinensis]
KTYKKENLKKRDRGIIIKKANIAINGINVEVYKECQKNHAAGLGKQATDGCYEYIRDDSKPNGMYCEACAFHRNFHHKVLVQEKRQSYQVNVRPSSSSNVKLESQDVVIDLTENFIDPMKNPNPRGFMIKKVKSEASTDNKCDDGDLSAQREAYGLGSDGEKEFRKTFIENNPHNKLIASMVEVSGVKWKSMSDAEKAVSVAKADKKKIEYNNSNTCRLTTRNWLKKTMLKMKRTV